MMTEETPRKIRYVYAVFGSDSDPALAELIKSNFSDSDRLELPSGDWFVVDESQQTSKVFEKINHGRQEGTVSMVVARADRIYGWHDSAIWDWIEDARNGRS